MTTRTIYRESTEYLAVSVTADVTLVDQTVELSVDNRATWLPAEWVGSTGTTREARVLLDNTNMPTAGARNIYVRITDITEEPVFASAGTARFI